MTRSSVFVSVGVLTPSIFAGDLKLTIAPTQLVVGRGQTLPLEASITNETSAKVVLLLCGDGSDVGLRPPRIEWSFIPVESRERHPKVVSSTSHRGFSEINAVRRSEVVTLKPDESRPLGEWIGIPTDLPPGRYRAVHYYTNDPKQKITGEPWEESEVGVERLIAESSPCKLIGVLR